MTHDIGKPIKHRLPRLIVWTVVAFSSLAAVGLSHYLSRPVVDDSARADFISRYKGGSLLIAGGGSLPREIRQRFLDLAGGVEHARLVIIPAYDATETQKDALRDTWKDFGVQYVHVLHANSRNEANSDAFTKLLDQATAVWLSGGMQSWLSENYAGTLVEEKLKAVVSRGGVIGGSSAGAAAMTRVMIEQGQEDAVEGVGLDLLQGSVIDQHFLRRSRVNRLLGLMESHPDLTAFGIDEGTALVVQVPRGRLGVIGVSYVLAYVPKTDSGESRFEVLKQGDEIDLAGLKMAISVSSPIDLDGLID